MIVCSNAQCRQPNDPQAPYCAACGRPLPSPPAPQADDESLPPVQVERSRNLVLFYLAIWIPVSIAIIVILGWC